MLADATRPRILWALIGRELSVDELAAEVGKLPASVSQHLAELRSAVIHAHPAARHEVATP